MYEAEIMITSYTVVVVTCAIGISRYLFRKKTKGLEIEINNLKDSLLKLEHENRKLKDHNET